MLRPNWLRRLNDRTGPRATRRRELALGMLHLEPRELLTVQALTPPQSFQFTEGADKTVELGQFTSPNAPSGLRVTIDWGDGTVIANQLTTSPTIVLTVSGSHTYADATVTGKPHVVAVIVTEPGDTSSAGSTATITDSATVSDGDPLIATSAPVAGTENVALANALVATFSSNDPDAVASDFAATIDWGDGVVSTGTILGGKSGVFSITGAHTFLDEGLYPIGVVVNDTDSAAAPTTIATTTAIAKGSTGGIHGATAQDFVGHTYFDILRRPPDQPSFNRFSQDLMNGTPFAVVASVLDHSAEYYGQVVDRIYETCLGRNPDPDGRAYWVSALEHGLRDESLMAQIIASDECFHNAGGENQAWIDAIYLSLFDRPADTAGKSYWLTAFSHGSNRLQIAMAIVTGDEYERFVVQADYAHFLGRAAGDAEANTWVQQMNQGMSDEDLATLIVISDEYLNRISA